MLLRVPRRQQGQDPPLLALPRSLDKLRLWRKSQGKPRCWQPVWPRSSYRIWKLTDQNRQRSSYRQNSETQGYQTQGREIESGLRVRRCTRNRCCLSIEKVARCRDTDCKFFNWTTDFFVMFCIFLTQFSQKKWMDFNNFNALFCN